MVTDYEKQRYDDLEKQKDDLGLFMDTSEYKNDGVLQEETLEKFVLLCEEQQKIIPYPYVKRQKYLLIKKTLKQTKKLREGITEGILDAKKIRNKIKSSIEKTFKKQQKRGGFRK